MRHRQQKTTRHKEEGDIGEKGLNRRGRGTREDSRECDQSTVYMYAIQEGYSLDKRINYKLFTQDYKQNPVKPVH